MDFIPKTLRVIAIKLSLNLVYKFLFQFGVYVTKRPQYYDIFGEIRSHLLIF